MARVSVIIPTYNRAHIVREAVDSVLAQTYRDFEIIVVDDASSDATRSALESYQGKIQAIFCETNGGAGAARNVGIRASSGEFVAFLDADDLYLPTRLETAVEALDGHPEYGAVYAEVRFTDPSGKQAPFLWVDRMGGGRSGWIFEEVLLRGIICTQSITVRRSILDRVGPFDVTLRSGQDWDLWWRIARVTQIGYLDEVVCTYRITPDGLSRMGVAAAESWVCRDRKALATFTDLTPRQKRLLHLRLYRDLRYQALYLAAQSRPREARASSREALRVALSAKLWGPALKAVAGLVTGERSSLWAQALRARNYAEGGR
jgi:glycosyltransferase involved in cell wall biosynthesis